MKSSVETHVIFVETPVLTDRDRSVQNLNTVRIEHLAARTNHFDNAELVSASPSMERKFFRDTSHLDTWEAADFTRNLEERIGTLGN